MTTELTKCDDCKRLVAVENIIDHENELCESCHERQFQAEAAHYGAVFRREGVSFTPRPVCEVCRERPLSDRADEHRLYCDECLETATFGYN